jgi:hypothetical protein
MIKYPLKTKIELITNYGDVFPCIITYAGKDTLHLQDIYKRIFTDENTAHDIKIQHNAYVNRDKFIGFSYPINIPLQENRKPEIIDIRKKMKDKDPFKELEDELTKKFDLDLNNPDNNITTNHKRKIPKDWVCDMYEFVINAIGGFEILDINRFTKTINILCDGEQSKINFIENFEKESSKHITIFLETIKNVNPKKYIKDRTYVIDDSEEKTIHIEL